MLRSIQIHVDYVLKKMAAVYMIASLSFRTCALGYSSAVKHVLTSSV